MCVCVCERERQTDRHRKKERGEEEGKRGGGKGVLDAFGDKWQCRKTDTISIIREKDKE